MKIDTLRIANLRSLADVSLSLAPGMNLFTGANGAGKTSVLEAAYLLSHAGSFRAGSRENLISRGAAGFSVFAEVSLESGAHHRLGFGKEGGKWLARVDGAAASSFGALVQHAAVVCFEPGSHALIAGPSDERRRFLDWGVFHVEHDFLLAWRRYQRALKQRNSLLRQGGSVDFSLLEPWESELAQSGQAIDAYRKSYLGQLRLHLASYVAALLPELGPVELTYRRGWPEELTLDEALRARRERDLGRGHTTVGCHRADWSIHFAGAPLREHLSRGQEKLTAMAALLSQAAVYAANRGEWPVICLDDLASELDRTHQEWVVGQLLQHQVQVLVTGTDVPSALETARATMFHVEQGQVAALL